MTNLREVAAFLLGEGELDGVGFGDPYPTERGNYWWRKHLRAALAQPEPEELGEVIPADEEQLKRIAKLVEQEPVAWMHIQGDHQDPCFRELTEDEISRGWTQEPLYFANAAPQREWVGLTDEEIKQLWKDTPQLVGVYSYTDIAREVEAKLKAKNAL